jgi:integrase
MLTTSKINSLKPKEKPYKVSDAHGLHIFIRPSGTKTWRQKYRYNGKEKLLTHGKYPFTTLAEARKLRDEALTLLEKAIDPAKAKRQAKTQLSNTFENLAKEWFDKQAINWKPIHADKVWGQIERDLFPILKDQPIDKISPTDLLEVLKKVEARGALDVASRLRQRCEGIFKHAILTERASTNPATQLVGVLKTKKVKHLNALDAKDLPEFFSILEDFNSHSIVKIATKIVAHTFVRSKELRLTVWSEIDFDARMWTIPAERMKTQAADHLIPMSDQVIELFRELQQHNGNREYVFASPQRPKQPLSENAMIQLLYRMGYKNRATVHGFRTTASTFLNESGYNRDAIERQLSHGERDQVRAAYNRSEYLAERTKMLNDWSKYLSSMTKKVISINSVKKA